MLLALKRLSLGVLLAMGFLQISSASAAEFNDKQRGEMGEIIREYLLKNPEVLRDAFQELERKENAAKKVKAQAAVKSLAPMIFRADGDLVVGNPEGNITMVEFFDYNCGFCKRSFPDVLKLIEKNKDLRVVMKEYPILGPGSLVAAQAAIASRKQGKYWDFHLALMKKRGSVDEKAVFRAAEKVGLDVAQLRKDMDSPEIKEIIRINHSVAQALNINGTPAFIIAEQIFPGAVGFDLLSQAVEKVRKAGGCKVCQ